VADESVELEVRLVADGEVAWCNDLMREHHGLGVAASGRVLRYVAQAGGVPVVLGTFGSAAWRVPARDAFTGWDPVQRAERLERVISDQRLCVLPAAGQVPFAASRALAAMLRRLPGDHEAAFRGPPGRVRVVHRPVRSCRDGVQGVRVHRGGPDRRVRPDPRRGVLPPARAAEGVLDQGAGAGRAGGAAGGLRFPAADRPARPGLHQAEHEPGRRVAAGVPGEGERSPQAEGRAARPGRDPGGGRGGPAVRGGLGLYIPN
jgi:hypothetical protein